MKLVSGADSGYFRSLLQLLLSAQRWGYCDFVVYDLGLSQPQRNRLQSRFPWVQLRDLPPGPPHLQALQLYAWKPTVVFDALQAGVSLLWLDSACVITGSLDSVSQHTARCGLWVPWAGRGALQDRTHPAVLEGLAVEPAIRQGRFRAGGICAFDPQRPQVVELVGQWRELAWQLPWLAPLGSHRGNHRFDQSLLSILLGRSQLDPSQDAIDISCADPISFLRTRNKVSNGWSLAWDPWIRGFFWLRRALDVGFWRLRDSWAWPI